MSEEAPAGGEGALKPLDRERVVGQVPLKRVTLKGPKELTCVPVCQT
ncbi:hypothetical protein PanWU01x14_121010 [Parasponia andersonii]|uniref:Uncharacterized protein n=1 Tax=Parasponia andersonii TaxID=3476 RepID=A0A2P5CV23_PARAD|nr:hypothetical protein PanWU01x14_121010 [Parasponia andersonii]